MCNYRIDWRALAERLHITVDEVKSATAYDEVKLREMADDGLITFDDNMIEMTDTGTPFVRNVAASLDRMMDDSAQRFSKPI